LGKAVVKNRLREKAKALSLASGHHVSSSHHVLLPLESRPQMEGGAIGGALWGCVHVTRGAHLPDWRGAARTGRRVHATRPPKTREEATSTAWG